MQQQAIITDMAKDVPKQNFSIEKAKLYCQTQIMFIIKNQEQFSMVYTLSTTEMTLKSSELQCNKQVFLVWLQSFEQFDIISMVDKV